MHIYKLSSFHKLKWTSQTIKEAVNKLVFVAKKNQHFYIIYSLTFATYKSFRVGRVSISQHSNLIAARYQLKCDSNNTRVNSWKCLKTKTISKMDKIRNGWFSEISDDLWPGQCFSLKVNKVLHEETSAFQEISILET